MTRIHLLYLLAIASIGLSGCSGAGSTPPDGPEDAPKVADLTCTPGDVTVGAAATITGRFAFEDVNADVSEVAIEVLAPGATLAMKAPRSAVDAAHHASGELSFFVQLVPPSAGDYVLTVYAVDAKQHESNRLTGLVHAK
jgi:hypothetical protein